MSNKGLLDLNPNPSLRLGLELELEHTKSFRIMNAYRRIRVGSTHVSRIIN